MKARFLLALYLAFGSVFLALPAQADPIATVWENSPVGVWLPEGVTFISVSGWYGSPDDPGCGVDVSGVLTALALGENHFDVVADNSIFGDPCGGVYKVLKITGIDANWQLAPEQSQPTPEPTQEPSASPTAEPSATPTPEQLPPVSEQTIEPSPSATPEPEPSPITSIDVVDPIVPVLPPVVEPVVTPPVIIPQPQPQPIPFPVAEPALEPAPTAEPASPTAEPAPSTAEPAPPSPEPIVPSPVASPEPVPVPIVVVTPPVAPESPVPTVEQVAELTKQDPKTLTDAQVELIAQVAIQTLNTEPQGSPAYNQALEQLMVVAQADDPEVPAELASIPLLGNAAVAVLDAFNQLGNLGADMSSKVRKTAKHEVIAAVIVGQVTTTATMAASSSMAYRRKETK